MPEVNPNNIIPDGEPKGGTAASDRPVLGLPVTVSLVVDGQTVDHDIAQVELSQHIDNHHVLKIRARELGQVSSSIDIGTTVEYASFLGKSISLTIRPEGDVVDASRELGFVGIVTGVDVENSIDALNYATITVHSPTISLDGAKKNAVYRDQSASDVMGAILRNYQITLGTLESAPGQMKYSVQYRETDYDYVMRLAGGCGLFAFYDGQEFRAMKAASGDIEELVWRETLGSFTLAWGTAPSEHNAALYNYEQKKIYSQDTKSLPPEASLSEVSKIAPDASATVFADSGVSTSAMVVDDAQSLDKVLQRDKARALGRMITCNGISNIPAVAVGHCVRISGMDKFDGTYWVTAVKHFLDESGTYHNKFTCTPLDIAYPQARSRREKVSNLQSAIVLDNNDPDQLGRIKVKFPWLESEETPWVRLMTPHAGDDRGWYSLPEIDDEVLVGYESGSPDHPIVLGAMYNKESQPPSTAPNPENDIKLFRTRGGSQISINDKDGSEEISITTKDGDNTITLSASGPSITIESKGDIALKGKNISIESDQEISLKAGSNLKAEASANLETKATGNYKIEGAQVAVQGQAMVEVKGSLIKLN